MAQIEFDLSGRGGLADKSFGDLNDTTSSPNRRYLGTEGKYADGLFNPIRKYGYMQPVNNTFAALTGSLNAKIIATEYDSINDDAYFAESGAVIWKLDGLTDTSFTAALTINQTGTEALRDLEIYEINGTRCLFYAYNLNDDATQTSRVGILGLDSNSGAYLYDPQPESRTRLMTIVQGGTYQKMAQSVTATTIPALANFSFNTIRLRMSRPSGDNGGYTIRVSIQDDNGSDEPDGTMDAFGDIDPATLGGESSNADGMDVFVTLNASVSKSGKFWVVVEPTSFAAMTGSDEFAWWGSGSENFISTGTARRYNGAAWSDTGANDDFEVGFIINALQQWSNQSATNTIRINYNSDMFFCKADNGFMYLMVDNLVHKIDGTPSGGGKGTITEEVLRFPSYFKSTDAVDTRGRMYISVQSNPNSGYTDARTYSENTVGVYIWDRQSTIVGTRDFVPLYGVRDIKKLYVEPNGEVRAICIGDDRFTQIRSITQGGKIIENMGLQSYPEVRDGLKQMNNMTVWLGADGIIYQHGAITNNDTEQLYKIGTVSSVVSGTLSSGAIFVGNSESTQSRQAIILCFDDGSNHEAHRWYPHGVGTIDTVAQVGGQGDVYTLVKFLPQMSTVNSINVYMLPTSSSGSTVIGTIKPYFNQSTTAWASKTVTLTDAQKGELYIPVNKQYVNAVQLEIEFNTTQTLGNNDFAPIVAVIDYTPTGTINRKS